MQSPETRKSKTKYGLKVEDLTFKKKKKNSEQLIILHYQ